MLKENSNSIKWWQIIIVLISIISIGTGIIAFGYYPKASGMSLETRVGYIEREFKEDINEIKTDVKEIKQILMKEKQDILNKIR